MGWGLEIPSIDRYTFNDSRMPIGELYTRFASLEKEGWKLELICESSAKLRPDDDSETSLPIISLQSPNPGRDAIWFLSGIHGEEPAGPIALAQSISYIAKLGEKRPVVLLPLCNPTGYARNWRYPNKEKYADIFPVVGLSVGDSEHYLIGDGSKARLENPTSNEAACLTKKAIKIARYYNPLISIDLHEDDYLEEGYIYAAGNVSIAKDIVGVLSTKTRIAMDGKTRFEIEKGVYEKIKEGIVEQGKDGSIDELLSSRWIIDGGRMMWGPSAETVLVIETPAKGMALKMRVEAQMEVIKYICHKYRLDYAPDCR